MDDDRTTCKLCGGPYRGDKGRTKVNDPLYMVYVRGWGWICFDCLLGMSWIPTTRRRQMWYVENVVGDTGQNTPKNRKRRSRAKKNLAG
jgi:hypothetical protein